jgi:hypothetical protein
VTNYLKVIGRTLVVITIVHSHTKARWRERHRLGLMLATMTLASAEGL